MLTIRPKGVQIRSSRRNVRQLKHRSRPLGTSASTKSTEGPSADLDNKEVSGSCASTDAGRDANPSTPLGSMTESNVSNIDQSSVNTSQQDSVGRKAESVLGRADELRNIKKKQAGPYRPGLRPENFPLPKVDDHWEACNGLVDRYDNALCEGWNDDINTLLVFVGLFSAAVTAFTIESSQRLQQDPADTTNQLLLHISRQLAKQVTIPASLPLDYSASSSDRRVNIFWFLSLLVALMTALLGILCKQWLREYQKDIAMSPRQMLGLRQMRFESFNFWRVEDLIASLPLMLQLTLLLFLIGVLDFLWNCDAITAGIITIAAVLGVGAVFITTILPALVFVKHYTDAESVDLIPVCAYKSPQAWLCLRMVLFLKGLNPACSKSWSHIEKDILWYSTKRDYYTFRAIYWLDELFSHNQNVKVNLSHCMSELEPSAHPDIFPHRATEGHPSHAQSIFLEGEIFDPRIPLEPKAHDQGPWGTLTTRILFQYMKAKVPNARDARESHTLAAFRASFAEVTLLLACHSPEYLSHHLEHDAKVVKFSPLNKNCSLSIADLYSGPLSVQRSVGPDGVGCLITASFLCANIGPVMRFFMRFFQDSEWDLIIPTRQKRSDCYVQMSSSILNWLEETKSSERTYVRYNMLDSIEADQILLTFELIQNTVTEWADRAQRLGLPTLVDLFTVLDFLDRTSDDGSNGREEEWKVLVTEVLRQLDRLQSECAYFSLPHNNKQYENQDVALVK